MKKNRYVQKKYVKKDDECVNFFRYIYIYIYYTILIIICKDIVRSTYPYVCDLSHMFKKK